MDTTENEYEGLCISKEEIEETIEYFKDEPKYTKPMILVGHRRLLQWRNNKERKRIFS